MSELVLGIACCAVFAGGTYLGWVFSSRKVTECKPDNHNFRQLNDSSALVCRDCGKKIWP